MVTNQERPTIASIFSTFLVGADRTIERQGQR